MADWREAKQSAERGGAAEAPNDADVGAAAAAVQKWGALASFLMAAAFIIPPWIYLTGNTQAASGPIAYALADFLYGPVWAACLVAAVFALRERIGERAPRRMALALLAALVAAGAMVGVAGIRAANRQYLMAHPELPDQLSAALLTSWSTIVAGVIAAGWHFFGWALLLAGSAGWTSRRLPGGLSALSIAVGAASLFVYALPDMAGAAAALGVLVSVWQGIVLWSAEPGAARARGRAVSHPDRA